MRPRKPTVRLCVILLSAAVLFADLACSEGRYFPDQRATREYFYANRQLYTDIAEDWLRQGHEGMFAFFGEGDYRWDSTFIKKSGSGYQVNSFRNTVVRVATFDEAAVSAGVALDVLTRWIALAKQAKLYSVTSRPWGNPDSPRYVEIMLWGSEHRGYGFRYVPPADEKDYDEFLQMIRDGQFSIDSGEMSHIEGRWFYFEGVR